MATDRKTSWGKLFGGCAVILLAVVVAGVWLKSVRQKKLQQIQSVRRIVLQPYWDALPGTDFQQVCEQVCTPKRNEEAPPSEIAAKYQSFTQTHGPRTAIEMLSLADAGVVADTVHTRRVQVQMTFAKGKVIELTYLLQRTTDKEPWLIASVTSDDESLELPTF